MKIMALPRGCESSNTYTCVVEKNRVDHSKVIDFPDFQWEFSILINI